MMGVVIDLVTGVIDVFVLRYRCIIRADWWRGSILSAGRWRKSLARRQPLSGTLRWRKVLTRRRAQGCLARRRGRILLVLRGRIFRARRRLLRVVRALVRWRAGGKAPCQCSQKSRSQEKSDA